MARCLRPTRHIARKTYTCNACEWIIESLERPLHYSQFTYAELRAIVKARRNGWQIKPGDTYIRQVVFDDDYGTPPYTWRAIPAIHDICLKYDFYEW